MQLVTMEIGGVNLYTEYKLIVSHKEIGYPELYTKLVEVPARDGLVDYTNALSDKTRYKNRTITVDLLLLEDDINKWQKTFNDFCNIIHGNKQKIIFSDDAAYYYFGIINVEKLDTSQRMAKISLSCDCEPFKYDTVSSTEPWLWDTFDFEDGYINDNGELDVDGTITAIVNAKKLRVFPTFTCSAPLTLTFKGVSYNLKAGSQKLYNLFFDEGENEVTISGTGTISIEYIGGSL